ncbi:MAG: DUF1667 domain-containing protein [Treponema sp.]|nr:DUF1667 domain-containing protein [Treponema sp.]
MEEINSTFTTNNKRSMTCIICPMGCPLEVIMDGNEVSVSGNSCKRGVDYAKKELFSPSRTLTCTVSVLNGKRPLVSAKTSGEIPKDLLLAGMEKIRRLRVNAPVKQGEILEKDFLQTGFDLIACEDVEKL